MQKSNAPTKLTVVFASGTGAGPVNNVPLTPGSTPGTASYQTGFTSVNMEPVASGGIPPFGADFNGLHKAATTAQIWQQCGFTWTFDSTFAGNANIGGYPAQSVLMMGNGNGLWINKTDNNTTSPDATGSAGWLGLPAVGATTIATTGGTKTPDPSVLGVTTLLITGALTSNAVLVLPLTAGARWIVANNTTGSFTLTVHGATGTGVSITQGSALTVFTDGTNYFAASANISGQYLPINGTAVAATKLATPRAFSITGLATAAAINFDGTANVTFNVTALNVPSALGYTPANDSDVVHIAGTETITGAKTFNSKIISGGLACIQQLATGSDLSHHVSLYQGLYGVNVTTGSINVVFNGSIASSWTSSGFSCLALNAGSGTIQTTGTGTFGPITGTTGTFSGAVSSPSYGAVNGTTGTFSGAISYTTSNATGSDRRLKRGIRKFTPRPLHRSVRFVEYTLKENGWHGLGSVAQEMMKVAPEHVPPIEKDGKQYLGIDYTRAAYEQAMWSGQEIDRLTKRLAKLERVLAAAKIEPRKRGFCRRLLESIW